MTLVKCANAVDGEEEMARQILLSRRVNVELGGNIPQGFELPDKGRALDVGCGAGGWVLDVSSENVGVQIIGIDANARFIGYAQGLARECGFEYATFQVMDMRLLGDEFAPDTFNFINVSFIAEALSTDYSALAQTLYRLCRPGGGMRWTEVEFPITNSPACEELIALTCRALQAAGQSFSPPGTLTLRPGEAVPPYQRRCLGITPMLDRWLKDAGFLHIRRTLAAIEVSSGGGWHQQFIEQAAAFGRQIKPFLLEEGVIAEVALEQLLTRMREEVQQGSFSGLCYLLSVNGQKVSTAHL